MSLHSLYNTIYPFIVSTAHRKARSLIKKYYYFSESDFDDLMQEFAIVVLKKLDKYDSSKSSIKTFISRIINNKAADLIEYKKLKHKAKLESDTDWELIMDSISETGNVFRETAAFDIIDQIELVFDIEQAYKMLPEELIVLLEMLKTMSIREIAKVTKKSRTTIYKKIERLRAILIENDFDDYL